MPRGQALNLAPRQRDDPPDWAVRLLGLVLLIAGNALWARYPWWTSAYCWTFAVWALFSPDTFVRVMRMVSEG